MYKADRRLYLNAEGKVVEDSDPAKLTLLVHEGGTLPLARARELGLTEEQEEAPKSAREQRAAELEREKSPASDDPSPGTPAPTPRVDAAPNPPRKGESKR